MQLTKSEISNTQIIITTPISWDENYEKKQWRRRAFSIKENEAETIPYDTFIENEALNIDTNFEVNLMSEERDAAMDGELSANLGLLVQISKRDSFPPTNP
ncbi:14385_t:CDS:2, partial [Funneliformis geosporum]